MNLGNNDISPNSFTKEGFAEKYAREFMFMDAISFINQVFFGLFEENRIFQVENFR